MPSVAAYGITEQWYNSEEPLYSNSYSYSKDNPATSADVLHFTQMVWQETTDVGCYSASCAQGTVDPGAPTAFTVCNYWPQGKQYNHFNLQLSLTDVGNWGGEYGDNVNSPNGMPTQHETIQWSP
jgi:hypothetical protein